MRRRALLAAAAVGNPIFEKYMTIEFLEGGSFYVGRKIFQYCINGDENWLTMDSNNITVNAGDKVSFKANQSQGGYGGNFTIKIPCNILGNCMSLLFGDDADNVTDLTGYDYCFSGLFLNSTGIISVNESFLPATILSESCYESMFGNCSALIKAPILPATELTTFCYDSMFRGCSSLSYVKALFLTAPSVMYTDSWLRGVSSTGKFVKHPEATWDVRGDSGVPDGWTIKLDGQENGLFPATIVYDYENENLSNAAIAQYFLDKYPDMVISTMGSYTNISEDVEIIGSGVCDGKVIGVAKWSSSSEYTAILFYTENSLNNFHGLRVSLSYIGTPVGSTMEWFFD